MPTNQAQRNRIAKMKLIPVAELIKDKKLLLIDDSIVRGTQLGNDFLLIRFGRKRSARSSSVSANHVRMQIFEFLALEF